MNILSYINMVYMLSLMTIIKILCNPKRLSIISLLSENSEGLCVSDIAEKVKISQSLASHQLSYLEARGVVECERMGQTMCYKLTKSSLSKKLLAVIKLIN